MQTLTRYSVIIHFEPRSTNINTRCSHTFTPHTSVAVMYKAIKFKEEYMFVLNAAFMYFEVKYIVMWELFPSM